MTCLGLFSRLRFAVVTHKGPTPQGGHYIADVYDPIDSVWHRFDDERTTVVRVCLVALNPLYFLSHL